MKLRALTVWWDDRAVGTLFLDGNGELGFTYADEWLADPSSRAVSQSLPKRSEPFGRRATRPFFAGLLPEAAQRDGVAQALGVSRANDFRLLAALGGDVAGALSLWPPGEAPSQLPISAHGEVLDDAELGDVLAMLPSRPMLAGRGALRLSLAGAQQKLPVVLVDGRIALPQPGQPTTHILKPPILRFPATTENEAFSMRLAAAVGLAVAPVDVRRAGDHVFLLVERYDRDTDAQGRVHRLHQEDFCQALGVVPERKYTSDGGPRFVDCFQLLQRASAVPARDVIRLLDAAIFNVILGNADAHGKNFSLLYRAEAIELAPLYDLLCTVAYPDISPRFAMKLARRATVEEFGPQTWAEFAAQVGVSAPFAERRVRELADRMTTLAPRVAAELGDQAMDNAALERFVGIVQGRAARFL